MSKLTKAVDGVVGYEDLLNLTIEDIIAGVKRSMGDDWHKVINPESSVIAHLVRMETQRIALFFGMIAEYEKSKRINDCVSCGFAAILVETVKNNAPWWKGKCTRPGCRRASIGYGGETRAEAVGDWNGYNQQGGA